MYKYTSFFFISYLLLTHTPYLKAQEERGQIAINAGIGASVISQDIYIFGTETPEYEAYAIHTPEYGATVDIGLGKLVSIGGAYSYQSVKVTYQYSNGYEIVSRTNIAGRILFHLNKNHKDKFENYLGLRSGCSLWKFHEYNDWPFTISNNQLLISIQVLYGIRYYFTHIIGIHVEFGIGTPYLAEGGITLRINTIKPKKDNKVTTAK